MIAGTGITAADDLKECDMVFIGDDGKLHKFTGEGIKVIKRRSSMVYSLIFLALLLAAFLAVCAWGHALHNYIGRR